MYGEALALFCYLTEEARTIAFVTRRADLLYFHE
jgi:hypothetical protein